MCQAIFAFGSFHSNIKIPNSSRSRISLSVVISNFVCALLVTLRMMIILKAVVIGFVEAHQYLLFNPKNLPDWEWKSSSDLIKRTYFLIISPLFSMLSKTFANVDTCWWSPDGHLTCFARFCPYVLKVSRWFSSSGMFQIVPDLIPAIHPFHSFSLECRYYPHSLISQASSSYWQMKAGISFRYLEIKSKEYDLQKLYSNYPS